LPAGAATVSTPVRAKTSDTAPHLDVGGCWTEHKMERRGVKHEAWAIGEWRVVEKARRRRVMRWRAVAEEAAQAYSTASGAVGENGREQRRWTHA
jgi:hypothetical protein